MKHHGRQPFTLSPRPQCRFGYFLLFLIVGISLPLLLTACEKQGGEAFEGGSFLLTSENMQGFTVVRSDGASDRVVKEALRICQTISDATGGKVELGTDWQRENGKESVGETGETEEPLEVLVGITAREESQVLLPEFALADGDFYLLRTVGRKILIAATSESLLADAVDEFLNKYVNVSAGRVQIARQIDRRSDNYPLFSVIRGGESSCGLVLSSHTDSAMEETAEYIAELLSAEYDGNFRVYSADRPDSLGGMIVVGKADDPHLAGAPALPEGADGMVKYEGDRLYIIGRTEETAAAALSEFYAALRKSSDADFSGRPYARYDKETVLSFAWSYDEIPYFVGGEKLSEESIATAETLITFGGISEGLLQKYTEILQKKGFEITWHSVGDNKSFYADNPAYRLQVNYTFASSTASVYILSK